MSSPVWFITGCSSGFGEALTLEALGQGHKVIATARTLSKIKGLKDAGANIMELDVTAPLLDLMKHGEEAYKLYGRIDYLINNAGYSRRPRRAHSQRNPGSVRYKLFGLLNVTRAILPYMRKVRSGVIANVSSVAAWDRYAGIGMYCASKYAVTGLSESMWVEMREFGIRACCVEPGYFRSNFLSPHMKKIGGNKIKDYDDSEVRKGVDLMDFYDHKQPGSIKKGSKVMFDVLTEKTGKPVPIRLVLGQDASEQLRKKCLETIENLDEWKDLSYSTNLDEP